MLISLNYFCEINGVPVGLAWYNEVNHTKNKCDHKEIKGELKMTKFH